MVERGARDCIAAVDEVRHTLARGDETPWRQVAIADRSMFEHYAAQAPDDPFSYEASWAYYRQETRYFGMRRELDGNLWIAVIRYAESPFVFVFPPIGAMGYRAATVRTIATELRLLTRRRVIFRKVLERAFVEMARLDEAAILGSETFADSRDIPEDVAPQVIIDVPVSLAQSGADFMRIRNHVRRFAVEHRPVVRTLDATNANDVERLVRRWNAEARDHFGKGRGADGAPVTANEGAYTVFSDSFHDAIDGCAYFSHLVYVGGDIAGFVFAGRTSESSAALYASLALTCYRGGSEFLIRTLLQSLADTGVRHLNMGGSETINLFRYKSKFAFAALRSAFDVELTV